MLSESLRVHPDGVDYYLSKPGMISHAMPWDSDRDGILDEDPPEDLNGDGAITVMRIRDETGQMKTSTLDKRLLTTRKEYEKGEYRTLSEGIDNDNDGRFNEDDIGGINVNRNYPVFVTMELRNGKIVTGKRRANIGHLEGNAPAPEGYFLFSVNSQKLPSHKLEWIIKKDSTSQKTGITITASCVKGGKDIKSITF